jgi:hypothetical protein
MKLSALDALMVSTFYVDLVLAYIVITDADYAMDRATSIVPFARIDIFCMKMSAWKLAP